MEAEAAAAAVSVAAEEAAEAEVGIEAAVEAAVAEVAVAVWLEVLKLLSLRMRGLRACLSLKVKRTLW